LIDDWQLSFVGRSPIWTLLDKKPFMCKTFKGFFNVFGVHLISMNVLPRKEKVFMHIPQQLEDPTYRNT
jgi:hypothetical protein